MTECGSGGMGRRYTSDEDSELAKHVLSCRVQIPASRNST